MLPTASKTLILLYPPILFRSGSPASHAKLPTYSFNDSFIYSLSL
jgi:hypothetical protein